MVHFNVPMAPPRLPIALDLPSFVSPSFQTKHTFFLSKDLDVFIISKKNATSGTAPLSDPPYTVPHLNET